MDVIELTRQLGAALQQDERYKAFVDSSIASQSDATVIDLMAKIDALRTAYADEAQKEDSDEAVMQKLEEDFQSAYQSLMSSDSMILANNARAELDALMNYITQILYMCVNGEDPATCEPTAGGCAGGDCAGCGGGCGGC